MLFDACKPQDVSQETRPGSPSNLKRFVSEAFLPMELPKCAEHKIQMILRPLSHQTPEQIFCGTWYDCPACTQTVLFQSAALLQQLEEMKSSPKQLGLPC